MSNYSTLCSNCKGEGSDYGEYLDKYGNSYYQEWKCNKCKGFGRLIKPELKDVANFIVDFLGLEYGQNGSVSLNFDYNMLNQLNNQEPNCHSYIEWSDGEIVDNKRRQ